MRNHFFFSYSGNKRNEVDKIIDAMNLKNVKIITEPYCGTSSMSFYISTLYPNKYKYVLNDIDDILVELYNTAKDEEKLKELEDSINLLIQGIDKEKYNDIVKKPTLASYIIKNKIYCLRPGLFPNGNKTILSKINLIDVPIVKFLRTEQVEVTNIDGIECYKKYCDNKECLIFLDPPYLDSCNDMYTDKRNTNIYEYLYYNQIKSKKAQIILCLEKNWIITIFFSKYKQHCYEKKYEAAKKRKTTHVVITNKKLPKSLIIEE